MSVYLGTGVKNLIHKYHLNESENTFFDYLINYNYNLYTDSHNLKSFKYLLFKKY